MATERQVHRDFLNRYYGWSRHVYDASRKHYLLGRDRVLRDLLRQPWQRLIEIGPGTGRNLVKLHTARPDARYGGIEASDAMLDHARARLPWATLAHGYAEDADYTRLLGDRPDIVLFSYCLSMVQDPRRALMNARRAVAAHGQVVVVDFGDLAGLPSFAAQALRGWLGAFHVRPLGAHVLAAHAPSVIHGPGRYYFIATLQPLAAECSDADAAAAPRSVGGGVAMRH
jgi:S-adenosylmethionine-diacylgycerolhomoserine-N-methlytransferase